MSADNHNSSAGPSRLPRNVTSSFQWPLDPLFSSRNNTASGDTVSSSNRGSAGGFRDDLHNVFSRGLVGPLMEQSQTMGLGTWLRNTHSSSISTLTGGHHYRHGSTTSSDVILSMESGINETTVGADGLSTPTPTTTVNGSQETTDNNTDSVVGQYMQATRQSPELRAAVAVIEKYIPFILILLAKLIFDHKIGILVLLGLVITFFHANTVIRREVGKQAKRNLRSLLSVIVNLVTCIFFLLFFVFESDKLYYNLVFLTPFTINPPSIWDLLFVVGISDFVLKLLTIICKAIVVALPATLLPFQRKGKYYLFIEQTSQSYRSLVPIRPWIVYLLEAYTGYGKMVGVALCAAYIVAKGTHVFRGLLEWRSALCKLMQTVTYGCVPSREQMNAVGNMCPICQDNFRQPTLLNCKHIFCEECVSMWFDRERTCPMCRAQIADDPSWRDGSTTYFLQVF